MKVTLFMLFVTLVNPWLSEELCTLNLFALAMLFGSSVEELLKEGE